ncbi:MAG: alanine racemase, partial [Candidatus Hodarchaeales archaeon]
CYGKVALPVENSWSPTLKNTYVKSLSQEHGVIKVGDRKILDKIEVGDILMILPVHSCLTANLYSQYFTIEGRILDSFRFG